MGVRVENLVQTVELLSLPFSMIVFVGRVAVEGKRVVGVLWALLVENIVLAVVPVRECRMI